MTTAVDGLVVESLSVAYGGHVAVDGVGLHAPAGRLTGLIGPNGAGKTTTFNALCGLVQPTDGRVFLFGTDVSGLPPQARARLGLGRTFQRMELFDSLTVAENVALGREAGLAGGRVLRHVVRTARERDEVEAATAEALELCGITGLAARRAGSLATGERRLVELARAAAGGFRILLLDEPSSGLDVGETRRFGAILRELVARGVGILLVEHDMSLVMDVCDHLFVVDFGQMIFEGSPAETAASEEVRAAYLGTDATSAVAR